MPSLLSAEDSLLLVIDVQERFRPILFNSDQVVQNTQRMITGCNQLGVPVMVTEQYPKGLGQTVTELRQALAENAPVIEKLTFSCYGEPALPDKLREYARKTILICGIEAHVCVNQTVVELLENGYQVVLIEDAIGSRSPFNYDLAMRKLEGIGAQPSCVEMALFELMRDSRHPQFKAVQALVV